MTVHKAGSSVLMPVPAAAAAACDCGVQVTRCATSPPVKVRVLIRNNVAILLCFCCCCMVHAMNSFLLMLYHTMGGCIGAGEAARAGALHDAAHTTFYLVTPAKKRMMGRPKGQSIGSRGR